jgi:hypothetical protein
MKRGHTKGRSIEEREGKEGRKVNVVDAPPIQE